MCEASGCVRSSSSSTTTSSFSCSICPGVRGIRGFHPTNHRKADNTIITIIFL